MNFTGIERLDIVGTRVADTIQGGFGADKIQGGGGGDTINSGSGADRVDAGRGDDSVSYNHLVPSDAVTELPVFSLKGERGINSLNFAIDPHNIYRGSIFSEDMTIIGSAGGAEFSGTNFTLSNGASASGFEKLANITTGRGDDVIVQLGDVDNIFSTGQGDDRIESGLGVNSVDGGFDRRRHRVQRCRRRAGLNSLDSRLLRTVRRLAEARLQLGHGFRRYGWNRNCVDWIGSRGCD